MVVLNRSMSVALLLGVFEGELRFLSSNYLRLIS